MLRKPLPALLDGAAAYDLRRLAGEGGFPVCAGERGEVQDRGTGREHLDGKCARILACSGEVGGTLPGTRGYPLHEADATFADLRAWATDPAQEKDAKAIAVRRFPRTRWNEGVPPHGWRISCRRTSD